MRHKSARVRAKRKKRCTYTLKQSFCVSLFQAGIFTARGSPHSLSFPPCLSSIRVRHLEKEERGERERANEERDLFFFLAMHARSLSRRRTDVCGPVSHTLLVNAFLLIVLIFRSVCVCVCVALLLYRQWGKLDERYTSRVVAK